uniref:TGF-beta family profile domain-containing protein n=1 Tax=Mola mola TaxID=94237 RepID=A0A3Q3W714_MOLML
MTVSVLSNPGRVSSLNLLLLTWTGLSLCSPIRPPENHHRAPGGRVAGDNPLLDAQDFLSHFLSTMNFTELRPQPGPLAARKEPPEHMLELYNRFAQDYSAVPSANIVRSFKNQDSTPSSTTSRGVRTHPLLFNVSMRHHERMTRAELHLFTLVRKAQRPHIGIDCKVTIYETHEPAVWTKEGGKEGRRRGNEEVVEMEDLDELVTKHIRARDNSWVSFDLTHVVAVWLKSGRMACRLEVHIAVLGSEEEVVTERGGSLVKIGIDRHLEGKHNAAIVVFSDEQNRDHKLDKQELDQMIEHEYDLPENVGLSQQGWGHNAGGANQDEQPPMKPQSGLIYKTPSRVRRNVKSESCKRTPLFVNFKDIGWDTWIIQPLGYEAYKCNGVCNPPMTSEVSPTKHAIVQSLLSINSPERASRACCVPTKLEPISLLYHENGVVTFKHKYEGMVVAECGCR